jgi:hypothetical protein
MFEADPEYADMPLSELLMRVSDVNKSVVTRGRSILEVGRRAVGDVDLGATLIAWADNPEFRSRRWAGAATLGWIAAAAAGYSQGDPQRRADLKAVLSRWPEADRMTLLSWAKDETWFRDMADASTE